ncbi:MAG: acyl-CoA desaturase [Gammaproteobacteria bacterium]|nr:MAG: acyl-CoA desaturase [Gammaproteobacteria bacterium]
MSAYLYGLLDLSFWGLVAMTFLMLQISMMAVTLYLHRDQAHRAIDLHPAVRHFFRLWIWLTSGMVTREWVAVHRKHHALCEREGDPHSPVVFGLRKVLLEGAELYRQETDNEETLDKYGRGCPDDWVERNVYARSGVAGLVLMALIDLALFGVAGITIWAIQMLTMPVFAAGVINGLGHAKGYRNFESEDASTNLYPIAVLIGGEELHNNHHAFPTSAKFSMRPWEFDIGWFYIRVLKALRLCRVRRVAPQPRLAEAPRAIDLDTVRAVLQNRMHVLRDYSRQVIWPVLHCESRQAGDRRLWRRAKRLLLHRPQMLDPSARERLGQLLDQSATLRQVHDFRQRLATLWEQANVSNDRLVQQLRDWCTEAEASGIRALQDFAQRLRAYVPQPQPQVA